MKFHKMLIISVLVVPTVAITQFGTPERTGTGHKAMSERLSIAYNNIFTKGNMLLQAITDEQQEQWQQFFKQARDYIQKNEPSLLGEFEKIQEINQGMVKGLKDNYQNNVKSALPDVFKASGVASYASFKKQIDASKLNILGFNTLILYLNQNAAKRLEAIKNSLAKVKLRDERPAQFLKSLTGGLLQVIQQADRDYQLLLKEIPDLA